MKTFFSILIILASVAVLVGFANPWFKEARTLQAEVSSYNIALDNAFKLRTVRDDLRTRYTSFSEEDINRINTLLPDSVDNIRLIIQMDSLASKNNLSSLTNVRFESAQADGTPSDLRQGISVTPYRTFELQFSTSGSYADFVRFVRDIETSLRLARVKSVSFVSNVGELSGSGKAVPGSNIYTYELTVVTYWLPR